MRQLNKGSAALMLALTVSLLVVAISGATHSYVASAHKQALVSAQIKQLNQLNANAVSLSAALLGSNAIASNAGTYQFTPSANSNGFQVSFTSGSPTYGVHNTFYSDRLCPVSPSTNGNNTLAAPVLNFIFPDPSAFSSLQLQQLFGAKTLPSVGSSALVRQTSTTLMGQIVPGKVDIRASTNGMVGGRSAVENTQARVGSSLACMQYLSIEPMAQVYRNLLGREPHGAEINGGAPGIPDMLNLSEGNAVLTTETGLVDLESYIRSQNEYTTRGGSNGEMVTSVFRVVTGNQPTASDLTHWNAVLKQLGGGQTHLAQLVTSLKSAYPGVSPSPRLLGELYRMWKSDAVCSVNSLISDPNETLLAAGQTYYSALEPSLIAAVPGGTGTLGRDVIALYRMLYAREPSSSEISYLATLMSYGKLDSTLTPLQWASKYLRSQKEFSELGGCAVAGPPPECKLTAAATTIGPNQHDQVTLIAFGNATSVVWDGAGISYSGLPISQQKTLTGGSSGGTLTSTAIVSGPGGSNTCSVTITVSNPKLSCSIYASVGNNGCGPYYSGGCAGGGNGNCYFQHMEVRIPDDGVACGDACTPANTNWTTNNWFPNGSITGPTPTAGYTLPAYYAEWGGSDWGGYCDPSSKADFTKVANVPYYTDPNYTKHLKSSYSYQGLNYGYLNTHGKWPDPSNPWNYFGKTPNLIDGLPDYLPYNGNLYRLKDASGNYGGPGTDCKAYQFKGVSPLVIDFSGTGIELTSPQEGAVFALVNPKTKERYTWVKSKTAYFIALDINGNGIIDSIDELFGNNTTGPDGKKAANGFEALKKYDENGDGFIDEKDSVYSKLLLWQDGNIDGESQASELTSLSQMGIKSIDLHYLNKDERADGYGDFSHQRSVITVADGSFRKVYDLWFVPDVSYHANGTAELTRNDR